MIRPDVEIPAAKIDTTDPTGYPYGKAQNITTPGDGTGTPLIAEWLNDVFGFFAALLGEAGITPSGTPDKVGASQLLDAVKDVADTRANGRIDARFGWAPGVLIGTPEAISNPTLMALASLGSNRVAMVYRSGGVDYLATYQFKGSDWDLVGNALVLSTISISLDGTSRIAALGSARVALHCTNSGARKIAALDFDGADWAQVGNFSATTGVGINDHAAITSLSATLIAIADSTNDTLRAYSFDGTDWAVSGNTLALTSITSSDYVGLVALGATRVAFVDDTNADLKVYDFDGTDWTLTGNAYDMGSLSGVLLVGLNDSDVVVVDLFDDGGPIMRFDGTDWSEVCATTRFGAPATTMAACAVNGADVAVFDAGIDTLRMFRFQRTLDAPHNLSWV